MRGKTNAGDLRSPLHIHCAVIKICVTSHKLCVRGAGRRGRRPLQVWWASFIVAEPCCCRGVVSSTGERCSPLQSCCHRFRFFIQFSSCERGAGSAFLCDQNLSSCSPNSRPQNVSPYTATSQDIRFGIIPLYLSRKSGGLLHKKCNN